MRTAVLPSRVRPGRHDPSGSESGPHLARSNRFIVPVFIGLSLITVLWRIWLLAAPGVPPGVDGGNWLSFGHELLGGGGRLAEAGYPPLVPLLVSGAVAVCGPTLGLATVAGVSAAAPAVGAFLVLRWVGLGWAAVVLAAPLLAASALTEVAAWGGYPQLLASPLILAALWLLDRWLTSGDRRSLLGASVAGAVVLATSHFAAVPGALGALAVLGWRVAESGGRALVLRRVLAAAGLAGALALPLLGLYAQLVPAVLGSRGAEPSLATLAWADLPSRFARVNGPAWPAWAMGLGLAGAALVARRDPAANPLRILTAGLGLGLLAAMVFSREPRLLHETPVVASLGLGLWFLPGRAAPPRAVPRGWLVAAVVATTLIAVVGVGDLVRHRDRYAVVDPHLFEAIEWIREQTPSGSVVGVPSLHDAPLGWWVEGLGRRPALTGAPLRWLTFPEERRLAAEANRLFFVIGMPTEEGMLRARALGVDYVLLVKRSLAYDPRLVREYLRGERPAYENAGAVVLSVPAAARTETLDEAA